MPSNEEGVRAACQAVWSDGESDRVEEFYHEDFKADYPMTDWGEGLDGVRALSKSVRIGLPDYRESIDLLVDGGDTIVVELTIRGTHLGPMGGLEPTGREVAFRDVTILRLQDGKIIEQRGLTDYLSLFQQLGVDPMAGVGAQR